MRIIVLLFILGLSTAANAEYKFGWADFSVNRLNWSEGTKLKAADKQDFFYLELEGAQQFDWGDIYGFFDIENPGKPNDLIHTAGKGILHYYLFDTPFSLYAHIYNFTMLGFSEQNDVIGLGYQFERGGFQFKPFLGINQVYQTYFTGNNGYMGGWFIGYMFKIKGQEFMLADWHEWEFLRNEDYSKGSGGSRSSQNGAASIWWMACKHLTPGFQWRYASDKLGTPGTLNAQIFSLKYNF